MTKQLKEGQRVKLIAEINGIPKGFIGTLWQTLSDTMGVIQYGFDGKQNQELYTGVSFSILTEATQEDIESITNYKNLVNKNYHIGKKFRTEKGHQVIKGFGDNQLIEITGVKLTTNANNDIFEVSVTAEDGRTTTEDHEIDFITLSSPLFIEYNENMEQLLAEEVVGEGEYLDLRPGIRIKLKHPYDYKGKQYSKVLGTIMDIDGNLVRLWVNIDGEEDIIFVPLNWIYPATPEEINKANIEEVVDSNYLPGRKFKATAAILSSFPLQDISPAAEVEIIRPEILSTDVIRDVFIVRNIKTEDMFKASTYDLHKYFQAQKESKPTEKLILPEDTIKTIEENPDFQELERQVEQIENNEVDSEVVFHSLTINGFHFNIGEDGSISTDAMIVKENIDLYIKSLKKLKEYL